MADTLYVKAFPIFIYDAPSTSNAAYIYFSAAEYITQPNNSVVVRIGPLNVAATPFPYFPSTDDAIAYYKDVQAQALVDAINTTVGATAYDSYDVETVDAPVAQFEANLNLDNIPEGSVNKYYTETEKLKLSGVAVNASANAADSYLLARANHTGTESADVLTDGTTNKAYTATERLKLSGVAANATANSADSVLLSRANHTGTQSADTITDGTTNKAYTAAEKTKLAGLAAQVQPDWNATSGLSAIANKPTIPTLPAAPKAIQGITVRNNPFPVFKQVAVAAGVAVFYLTDDGTAAGNLLGTLMEESLNLFFNDAAASYQNAYTITNGGKTLTVTVNKLATANLLTGLLGQSAAPNGLVCRLQAWFY